MASSKVSDLTVLAAFDGTEILYIVDDPGGTPLDRKVTAAALKTYIMSSGLGDLLDWQSVRKAADESVTSSTTLQDDDVLLIPMGANQTWLIEAVLVLSADDAGDIKTTFTVPALATGRHMGFGLSDAATGGIGNALGNYSATFGTALNWSFSVVHLWAVVVNGANAGNVTLQWAQRASHATPTTVLSSAFITGRRIA